MLVIEKSDEATLGRLQSRYAGASGIHHLQIIGGGGRLENTFDMIEVVSRSTVHTVIHTHALVSAGVLWLFVRDPHVVLSARSKVSIIRSHGFGPYRSFFTKFADLFRRGSDSSHYKRTWSWFAARVFSAVYEGYLHPNALIYVAHLSKYRTRAQWFDVSVFKLWSKQDFREFYTSWNELRLVDHDFLNLPDETIKRLVWPPDVNKIIKCVDQMPKR